MNIGRHAAPLAITALALTLATRPSAATPSTNFWAPSTHAIQSHGVLHVTYDTYFNHEAAYPVDVGLTIGARLGKAIQLEAGFDLFYPTIAAGDPLEFPVLLNAKIGSPEGALFEGSPGWSAGIFGAGFEEDVTDYHVLHAMVGKTFPRIGALSLGGYYGLNQDLFRSSEGEEARAGVMAGWSSPAIEVPMLDHVNLTADIQSGDNVLGAMGGGVYLYVTPTVDLLVGPVFFFDRDLQPGGARWMWSLQLDADINLLGR
jgi:hypothetical protein